MNQKENQLQKAIDEKADDQQLKEDFIEKHHKTYDQADRAGKRKMLRIIKGKKKYGY